MTSAARRGRWSVVAVFLIAYWLSFFYRSTNAVIADDLARDVGLGASSLGLMTSLFFLVFAAVQLPLGSALDRYGARFVTPALLLAAVAGSLVFATATDFTGLALGRALIGLGMAGVLMGALKAFASWFDPRAFATVSSVFVGIGSLGALAAATPLAWLASAIGWRGVFGWGALVVLLAAVAIVVVAREPARGPVRGPARAPDRAPAPGHGVGAAATRPPAGFGQVFRDDAFWRLALLTFAVTGGLFAWQGLWAGPFLTQGLGLDVLRAGNVLLALGAGITAGFLSSGVVAARLGVERTLALGATAFLATLLAWLLVTPAWPLPLLVVLAALMGLTGASNVLSYAAARDAFPHMPGRAVTAVNLFGIGGGALLQWGLGAVIGAYPSEAGGHDATAFRAALVVTALLVAVALARYAPLTRRSGPRRSQSG
ncbi:MAG: MFS transporter [Trueperaceae bacterium]|nr:MAG: MFS transporter [Trueperaceae bacterium]